MKLHFLLVHAVAIGLLSSAPNSFAHGGGGGGGHGGGGHGGGAFHGGFHSGGFHGGFRGRGGRFFGGRFFGPGFGFYGYGYPWWGWWGWDYPYYPYYPYSYYGDYGSDASYGSDANYGGTRDSDQDPRFSTMRGVQAALAWRGYYSGRIDGVMGPETSAAIRSFQAHQGLPTTGRIDNGLVNALQRR